MERKLVSIENSLHQIQEFVIEEYDEHIVLAGFFITWNRKCGNP